jgi:tRNA(fMet)-specific endonuclease VapC
VVVLDTNAYSALVLGNAAIVALIGNQSELRLPLPVIAELRYGFAKGSRREHNENILLRFLAQSQVIVMVPSLKTTEYYARLQLFCSQRGRALSHNDLWIAALAQETGDMLVTFDRDFIILAEVFGDNLKVLRNE